MLSYSCGLTVIICLFKSADMRDLPNILTASRIGLIPVITGLFFVGTPWASWAALALYILAAITDFFDGWLARRWQVVSPLGRFLDPIADKLLIAAVLVLLVAFGRLEGVHIIPAILILMREITVSGLREFLAPFDVRLPVTRLAKWKTTLQMVATGFLILGPHGPADLPIMETGVILLWIAAPLTLWTGIDYLRAALPWLTGEKTGK